VKTGNHAGRKNNIGERSGFPPVLRSLRIIVPVMPRSRRKTSRRRRSRFGFSMQKTPVGDGSHSCRKGFLRIGGSVPPARPGAGDSNQGTNFLWQQSPLYLVDGVPTQNVSISPQLVWSTSGIVKMSVRRRFPIYGARASNGVIIITPARERANYTLPTMYLAHRSRERQCLPPAQTLPNTGSLLSMAGQNYNALTPQPKNPSA